MIKRLVSAWKTEMVHPNVYFGQTCIPLAQVLGNISASDPLRIKLVMIGKTIEPHLQTSYLAAMPLIVKVRLEYLLASPLYADHFKEAKVQAERRLSSFTPEETLAMYTQEMVEAFGAVTSVLQESQNKLVKGHAKQAAEVVELLQQRRYHEIKVGE